MHKKNQKIELIMGGLIILGIFIIMSFFISIITLIVSKDEQSRKFAKFGVIIPVIIVIIGFSVCFNS